MLIDSFVIIFVIAFIALAAFGHVLLAAAIWPKLARRRDAKPGDSLNSLNPETRSAFDNSAKAA